MVEFTRNELQFIIAAVNYIDEDEKKMEEWSGIVNTFSITIKANYLLEQHQEEALRVRKNECEEVICDHPKQYRSLPLFGYPQKCRKCGDIISK